MKNQIVKKKRFQLAFASLPKEYHYYVKETNELTICRDCKRWHFEIAGMAVWCVMQKAKKTTRVKATTFVHLKNCLKHLIKCSQDAEANFLRNKCRNMQCTGEIRL